MQLFMGQEMTPDDPLKTLAVDYYNLFVNGAAFSDVIFCVEGKQVHAHRCILAARSSFFRTIFCKGESMEEVAGPSAGAPQFIPVGIVGYDVFLLLLRFLYSGQLVMIPHQAMSKCSERGCWHTHCSSAVDLALDTLHAANFFGVEQLSILIQKHLAVLVEKVAIEDVMRVLIAAKKQELQPLWDTCSELVAKSGLNLDALRKHLPVDVATEIEGIRFQRGYGMRTAFDGSERGSLQEQRIRRMRQALDCSDVELVKLMVMGEGLDLDKAQALHYSVANCSRDVVKALLELGAVDVNYPGSGGRTALHLASEMANADMIAVLLDHHASPRVRSEDGGTPLGTLQSLMAVDFSPANGGGGLPMPSPEHNKLRLCVELVQSAMYVACKEDELSDGVITEQPSDSSTSELVQLTNVDPDCCSTPSVGDTIRNVGPDQLNPDSWAEVERSYVSHANQMVTNFGNVSAIMNVHPLDDYRLATYPDFRFNMMGGSESIVPSAIFS